MALTPDDIRRTMDRASITQVQLADILGVEQATVSRWLNGSRSPSGDHARRLHDLIAGRDALDALDMQIAADASATNTEAEHDAMLVAERSGASPLTSWLAGSAVAAHGRGEREADWVLERVYLGGRLHVEIDALKRLGVWPWA